MNAFIIMPCLGINFFLYVLTCFYYHSILNILYFITKKILKYPVLRKNKTGVSHSDSNVRPKTIKLLEESIGSKIFDI